MARNPPKGFREGHDSSLACPHRDISCCPQCALQHEEIVNVYGRHYWIADKKDRDDLIAQIQKETT